MGGNWDFFCRNGYDFIGITSPTEHFRNVYNTIGITSFTLFIIYLKKKHVIWKTLFEFLENTIEGLTIASK